jgi:putative hydrolase of the HAD superfamily
VQPASGLPSSYETLREVRPRIVFFDMGGTLAYPHPSFHGLIASVCQANGLAVTEEEVARAEPAVWERIAQREGGARGFTMHPERSREFWLWVYQTFLGQVGCDEPHAIELSERLFATFIRSESYRLYDDSIPTLERVRNAGLQVGVISNWEEWLERLMVDLNMRHHVDVAVISGVAGMEKPDPEIFQHALSAAGVTPEQAIHVGDNIRDDVEGAEAVGIRGILIDRTGARGASFGPAPDRPPPIIVRSLLEIPDLLGLP